MGLGPRVGVPVCTHFPPPPPPAPPRAPRKLQHRNLVRLLGVILHHGLYIVMEHMSKVCGVADGWMGGVAQQPGDPQVPPPQTGQPGELPAHAGPRPREHISAPAVFPVSDIPSGKVGPEVEWETEA